MGFAEKDKNIFSLQPKILSLANKKKFDYAGASGGFIDIYGYPICRGRVFEILEKDDDQYDDVVKTFWSCGVAMIIRKNILKKIGLFDPDFFAYGEEIDLCWRAQLLGYRNVVVPSAKVYHMGEASFKKFKFKKYYLLHRNHLMFLIKNYSLPTLIGIFPLRLMLEFVSIVKFQAEGNFKRVLAILCSLAWITLNIVAVLKKHNKIQKRRSVDDKKIGENMINRCVPFEYYILNKKYFEDYKKYLKE